MRFKANPRISRRDLLRSAGVMGAGLALWSLPPWLHAAARVATGSRSKTLVVLFQRGAADGLNTVIPFTDPNYSKARPTVGLKYEKGSGVLDLDGHFGFHPSLAPLFPLWKSGHLAAIHCAGSPDETRSHFDAQDYMETGTPGVKGTSDGWLNRTVASFPSAGVDPLSAIAISARPPRILRGEIPVTSMTSLKEYTFTQGPQAAGTFEEMYSHSNGMLGKAGIATSDSIKKLQALLSASTGTQYTGYGNGYLGRSLSDLAAILKSGAEVKTAFVDIGGWDHHTGESYRLGSLLEDWGKALSAFWRDLGDKAGDVVVVSMTEFGRTVAENGSQGTDHGHGGVMFVLGGPVKGGKVYGKWAGLEREKLYEGRDLPVTTDFRQVLCEALGKHLGVKNQAAIFPGFKPGPSTGWI